jgi:hypothetical protein
MKIGLPKSPRPRAAALLSLLGLALLVTGLAVKQGGFGVGWILLFAGGGVLFAGVLTLPIYWWLDYLDRSPDWLQIPGFYLMFGVGIALVVVILFQLQKC